MKVSALTVDPFTSLPVVILEDGGRARLAICVGLGEASAIAAELDGIELERPMTHHLMCDLLEKTGASVVLVEVSDLVESTYYATIHLRLADGRVALQDARPSDALALALRTGAEIRVAAHVVEKAARLDVPDPGDPDGGEIEEIDFFCTREALGADDGTDYLDRLGDEVFGKWKM
jgi:uncharacterized protein